MKYDVFISYSSQDQKIVEGVCNYLEARGIRCFVSYRDIPRGVVWARAIVDALDESRMMVVVFSDSFNNSRQVDREIEIASEDNKPILTFRLCESKFEGAKKYYLKNLNWIDAFPNQDDAFDILYQNVCRLLKVDNPNTNADFSNPGLSTELNSNSHSHPESIQSQSQNHNPVPNWTSNTINGYKFVDLGLPSGLKWATFNLGAVKREDYGDYFSWGEVAPKKSYTEADSLTMSKETQFLRLNGIIGGDGNLTLAHDAARQRWGGSWRMPTAKEIEELKKHTTSKFGSLNGVKGRLLKSTINGERIFFPASGFYIDSSLYSVEDFGNLWSSTPYASDNQSAYHLSFNSKDIGTIWSDRSFGFTIRAVSE